MKATETLYMVHGTISRSVGKVLNLHTVYRTIEGLCMMYETSKDFMEFLERFVSILRNLKRVGAKAVNLYSSVINFFLQL